MAGHSKWSKVKHIKAVVDAKKGQAFSKASREITLAAKGGGDPSLNSRLRTAIEAARAVNMTMDTIERAVKKGTGELGGEAMTEITYEAYAPGGVAMIIECATDNKNRSANDVRATLSRNHGTLGSVGSVAHQFARKGEIRVPMSAVNEDKMLEAALDAGAEDVTNDGDDHIVTTEWTQLFAVGAALKDAGIVPASQKLIQQPQSLVAVTDPSVATQVIRLYELLDGLDDVQNVYTNFDIPDEVMAEVNL